MNIIVLGSGLLGVSTAYELGKRGFGVTVVERRAESAAEGSYSNGAQLSYSHAEPWASLHVLPKLPFWIVNPSAPLVFSPRADWQMIKWGLRFLRNCTPARARENCINILRLGLYSKQEFARVRAETGVEFAHSDRGILRIYQSDQEFDHAKRQSEFQAKYGCRERFLSREECIAHEPVLQYSHRTIAGGIHAFMDETGDAYAYCKALAAVAQTRHGVKFLYNTDLLGFRSEAGRIAAAVTDKGELSADGYVMAMGPYSAPHMRRIGVEIPVYPMKGYSITIEANEYCPLGSITDGEYKIVHTRVGNKLRVAGTAEFSGYGQHVNPRRIAPIVAAAKTLLPKANWDQDIVPWACLRPSTPDGPPVLGRTPYANLFLNTGHGTLGWTQAAGSASILADIMEEKTPKILMNGLTLR